jgi:hypothetical protein
MRIDGTGSPPPILPAASAPPPAPANAQTSITSLVNEALLQQQQGGGGGHHGGGHGVKKAGYEAIDDIAARASLNVKRAEKSVLERQREIERMRAEQAAKDAAVGEREDGGEQQHAGADGEDAEDEAAG